MAEGTVAGVTSPDPLPALLEPFVDDPGRSAVITDFDGTLAPIVDDPEAADALPGAVATLHALARHISVVAVVSGRPVPFLQRRLVDPGDGGPGRLVLAGLYGMERSVGGTAVDHPDAAPFRAKVEDVAEAAAATLSAEVLVERKGLSVALHARTCPAELPAVRAFAEQAAAATGLRLVPARMAVELRPPVAIDKGTVVAELVAGCTSAMFLGDDRGDLEAFEELERLRAGGATVLKVAARSDEAPPELLAAADLQVDGPHGVVELLGRLAASLAERDRSSTQAQT